MQKEAVSIRIDPQFHSLCKRIAKEEYGDERKKGYVIENALQVYQAHRTRPMEATVILSVTEEKIIDRLDKRFNDIGKDMIQRIGNLVAKSSYETSLQSIMLQDVYYKAGFKKADYEQKRKEAAYRMKGRLEKEGIEEISGVIEENEHLKKVNNDVENRLKEAAKAFGHFKAENERLEAQNKELKEANARIEEKSKDIKTWSNGLVNYLAQKGSPLKKNSSLIEEYIKLNPIPGE